MTLDYSVPPFQLLIGSFNVTDYLDAISLSLPFHEPSQPLVWTGRFRVSRNLKAIQLGVSDAQFDQFDSPQVWRPYQSVVTLSIQGYYLPTMRIERYAYNRQTGAGEGTLTQILQAANTDRPATEPDITVDRRSIYDTTLLLLNKAFEGATIPAPGVQIALTGDIYGGLTTRNPVADAQRLCASNWKWLTVDDAEVIRSIDGDPNARPLVFSRTLQQVEWEPDIDNIDFAAKKVIVTGSRQVPDPTNCENDLNPNLDAQARPKVQKTVEKQPAKSVFSGATSLDPVVAEQKWIFYQYEDDPSLHSESVGLIPVSLLFEVQTQTTPRNVQPGQPYQVITIKRWPAGRIFTQAGTNATLYTAELEIQNEIFKAKYVPKGLLDSSAGQDYTLVLEKREDLTTKPVLGNPDGGAIDPATGNPICLVPKPKEEPRQKRPEVPLKTVPIRGEAVVQSAGWTPILPRTHVVEMGFVPSNQHAQNLAEQIARREQRRRDAVQVTMPIPFEWLQAGCPPLAQCQIGDRLLHMDGVILEMADAKARFSFSGGTISQGGVEIVEQIYDLESGFALGVDVGYIDTLSIFSGYAIGVLVAPYELVGFRIGVDSGGAFQSIGFRAGVDLGTFEPVGFRAGVDIVIS